MVIRKRRHVLLCKIKLYNINYQNPHKAHSLGNRDAARITESYGIKG